MSVVGAKLGHANLPAARTALHRPPPRARPSSPPRRLHGQSNQDEVGDVSRYRIHSWVRDIPPPYRNRRVRAKDAVKARARELRCEGRTYTDIANELGVSKSSCSLWCSDLPRPEPEPGKLRASTWGPGLRRRALERANMKLWAAQSIDGLTPRELFLVGVALYWAEGTKDKPYDRREYLAFINSDPGMVRVYLAWLRLVGVDPARDCSFRVSIHERADVEAATRCWAEIVGIEPRDFAKATLKRHNPRTNRKNVSADYHGCLVIRVLKSANLYQRVEGWWFGIVVAARDDTLETTIRRSLIGRTPPFGGAGSWFESRRRSEGLHAESGLGDRPTYLLMPWLPARVPSVNQLPGRLHLWRPGHRFQNRLSSIPTPPSLPRRPVEPGAPPP